MIRALRALGAVLALVHLAGDVSSLTPAKIQSFGAAANDFVCTTQAFMSDPASWSLEAPPSSPAQLKTTAR
jgi:hypothetical protein